MEKPKIKIDLVMSGVMDGAALSAWKQKINYRETIDSMIAGGLSACKLDGVFIKITLIPQ
jgi:hypothetical protein